MLQGKWTGGGHVFFDKYSCNLSYIFINKILFYYNVCQKWLDNLHYLLSIQIVFFQDFLYHLKTQSNKQ
jgi:hypothetical protein